MRTIVSAKGQIVLPAELRELDRIEPGQEFDIERVDRRRISLGRTPDESVVDWPLACPAKGYVTQVETS